ncbi:uncharacterized protein ARMOST_19285 [Armillaria ostoyae]|uniref:Uncharacterized protein n=1 Tax=Armillaria ostoyae TaxID=47428 RepID=A0A284S446_ARMOS|nr:uncharacterized protein ARMOST_19285 [Armillaria ostoyae]
MKPSLHLSKYRKELEMDDHANEMEVIGGYSYTYPDVKIMSARMDPPPHPSCPPGSLIIKMVVYLKRRRLLVTLCEDPSVPERRRLVVATQSQWVPMNDEGLATRFYPRDPEDTLLKREFCKIFPGLTEDPEYVTLVDPFLEVRDLTLQQRLPIVMTTPGQA